MKYFEVKEFVSPDVYRKHGEMSIKFICPMLLETISIIREKIGKPITINNWHVGGGFTQRGLRENISDIVSKKTKRDKLYLSAHTMGKAFDFDVKGMKADDVRKWILDNQKSLPHKIRLEHKMNGKPITWIHVDLFQEEHNPKVYLFDV